MSGTGGFELRSVPDNTVSRPQFQQSSEPGALDYCKQSVAVGVDYLEHEEAQATTPCLLCLHSLSGKPLPALMKTEVSGRCFDVGNVSSSSDLCVCLVVFYKEARHTEDRMKKIEAPGFVSQGI